MVNQIIYLFGCLKVVGIYNYFTFTSYFVLEDLVSTNYIYRTVFSGFSQIVFGN